MYHPDVNKSPDADKISKALNNARDTLLNAEDRKKYDQHLFNTEQEKKNSYTDSINKNRKKNSSHQENKTSSYSNTYNNNYQETDREFDQYDNTYFYLNRWQAISMWLKYSHTNIFIKCIGCLLIAITWVVFRIFHLMEIPIIIGETIIKLLTYGLAGLGIFILVANFLFSLDAFRDMGEYLLFGVQCFLPALIGMTMEYWLPALLMKLESIEDWIIVKITNM